MNGPVSWILSCVSCVLCPREGKKLGLAYWRCGPAVLPERRRGDGAGMDGVEVKLSLFVSCEGTYGQVRGQSI